MSNTAVIFDIDGTLLKSEHLDAAYFVQAVREVVGNIHIAKDWSCYKKVTDVGIITEILEQNNIATISFYIAAIRRRFGELLDNYFTAGGTCLPVAGSSLFLERLLLTPSCSVGIATGGWRHSALMKLAAAGIDVSSIPISTSDDGEERTEIMMHCLKQLNGTHDKVVYIGDGIWDRDASEQLGWHFIGIGSKMHHKCDYWFKDFSEGEKIMHHIENS